MSNDDVVTTQKIFVLHGRSGPEIFTLQDYRSKIFSEDFVISILYWEKFFPNGVAKEVAHRFLLNNPDSVLPLLFLAAKEMINGDNGTTAKLLRTATLRSPSNPAVCLMHAFIARAHGDLVRMASCLTRAAITLPPSNDLIPNFVLHTCQDLLRREDRRHAHRLGLIAYQYGATAILVVAVNTMVAAASESIDIAVTHRATRTRIPVRLTLWSRLDHISILLGELPLPVAGSANHPVGIAFFDDGESFVNTPLTPLSADVDTGLHAVPAPTLEPWWRPPAPPAESATVDIVIPVYNRPDFLQRLIVSLQADPAAGERIGRLVIVDDASDAFTAQYLETLPGLVGPKLVLLRNSVNLGFLETCNRGFEETQAPFIVLLNSDVELPAGWLDRLLAPFLRDPTVGLVTPLATSGANLTVSLTPGQDWRDADAIAGRCPPRFADACTAIGYCLAIRREALPPGPLFDPVYSHGYGEDSDLHYRVKKRGGRSVVCDNLIVQHHGTASYILQPELERFQSHNRRQFFARWGMEHIVDELTYELSKATQYLLDHRRNLNFILSSQKIDVLFILPTDTLEYGGIRASFGLVQHLLVRGWSAKIVCLTSTDQGEKTWPGGVRPYLDINHLMRDITDVGVIVPTCIDTIETANLLRSRYGAPVLWFLQGPEAYFSRGATFPAFRDALQGVDDIVCVSDFLRGFVHGLCGRPSKVIPFGPNPLVFYPRSGVQRRARSIAVSMAGTLEKGAGLVFPVLELLRARGFKIFFFGKEATETGFLAEFGTVHGFMDSIAMARLFSEVEFYLDFSLYEGLGLLPLEAAFCGAIPVMTRKGAPETIFTPGENAIIVDGFLDFQDIVSKIVEVDSPRLAEMRRNALQLRAEVSEQAGYTAFERNLWDMGLKPQGAGRGQLYRCAS